MVSIKPFATNNLVKEHDIYVNFMENRDEELKKDGLTVNPPERLFYKQGNNKAIVKSDSRTAANQLYRAATKWHCIMISYDIWCKVCKGNVIGKSAIPYKQSVHLSVSELHAFRTSVENAIAHAECDYNTRCSHYSEGGSRWNACRYLAIFWTYLDIVKDTKTQRYLPDSQTRANAAKEFGYEKGQNPFEMNGRYYHWKEETKMEEVNGDILEKSLEDLDFSVRTENCLYRAGVRKFGSLLMLTVNDILHIRNLGINSFREVVSKLQEYGYTYPEDKSNPRIPYVKDTLPIKEQSEESVIDIAEEAAKKVEEERAMPEPPLRDLRETFNKLKDDYDKLDAKHDELLKTAQEQAGKYDKLLEQKLECEAHNSRLRDEISILKDRVSELVAANKKVNIASNPKNFDTFTLLNIVLEKMKDSKTDNIFITVDGMTVDIHKKFEYPFGKADSYTIRTREAR